jgi:L-ascorbate metabolism protein UlaG (beta-lactamase superfamily)
MNKRYLIAIIVVVFTMMACASQPSQQWQSDHYSEADGFYNAVNMEQDFSFGRFLTIANRFLFDEQPNTEPFGLIPIKPIEAQSLQAQQNDVVYRLGHSTILMKLSGQYILTDPMFSERASPVQWIGPKRFHPVPLDVSTLPNIHTVIISHDHYDHLDEDSIKLLANKTQNFVVPLGVGQYLLDWGVASDKIHEMDWWQSQKLDDLTFVSTPSQHFSGRGLFNRNGTLWSSWVINSPKQRIFFSGDSGYFDGFKAIGEKYGPFDLTILENGAYNPDWAKVHMFPAQTIQAHMDLKGKAMLPVHNGTFKLSFHPWKDPLEKVSALGEEKGVPVLTPKMGEMVRVDQPNLFEKWWQAIADE